MLEIGEAFENQHGSDITLTHIISNTLDQNENAKKERLNSLYEGLSDLEPSPDSEQEAKRSLSVEISDNVVGSIINLSSQHDLTIIGAAREGWFQKLVAGTKPEQIAKRAKGNLLLVKNKRTTIHSGWLDLVEFFKSREPESVE